MSAFTASLERARRAASPRYAPPPTPLTAILIHGGVMLLWVLLFLRAFGAGGVFAWSVGLAYIGYDTALLLFVFWQTRPLLRAAGPGGKFDRGKPGGGRISLSVIIAAHNEAAVLPETLAALFAQTEPPDEVIIADDGSDDGTAALLAGYGLPTPAVGEISGPRGAAPGAVLAAAAARREGRCAERGPGIPAVGGAADGRCRHSSGPWCGRGHAPGFRRRTVAGGGNRCPVPRLPGNAFRPPVPVVPKL